MLHACSARSMAHRALFGAARFAATKPEMSSANPEMKLTNHIGSGVAARRWREAPIGRQPKPKAKKKGYAQTSDIFLGGAGLPPPPMPPKLVPIGSSSSEELDMLANVLALTKGGDARGRRQAVGGSEGTPEPARVAAPAEAGASSASVSADADTRQRVAPAEALEAYQAFVVSMTESTPEHRRRRRRNMEAALGMEAGRLHPGSSLTEDEQQAVGARFLESRLGAAILQRSVARGGEAALSSQSRPGGNHAVQAELIKQKQKKEEQEGPPAAPVLVKEAEGAVDENGSSTACHTAAMQGLTTERDVLAAVLAITGKGKDEGKGGRKKEEKKEEKKVKKKEKKASGAPAGQVQTKASKADKPGATPTEVVSELPTDGEVSPSFTDPVITCAHGENDSSAPSLGRGDPAQEPAILAAVLKLTGKEKGKASAAFASSSDGDVRPQVVATAGKAKACVAEDTMLKDAFDGLVKVRGGAKRASERPAGPVVAETTMDVDALNAIITEELEGAGNDALRQQEADRLAEATRVEDVRKRQDEALLRRLREVGPALVALRDHLLLWQEQRGDEPEAADASRRGEDLVVEVNATMSMVVAEKDARMGAAAVTPMADVRTALAERPREHWVSQLHAAYWKEKGLGDAFPMYNRARTQDFLEASLAEELPLVGALLPKAAGLPASAVDCGLVLRALAAGGGKGRLHIVDTSHALLFGLPTHPLTRVVIPFTTLYELHALIGRLDTAKERFETLLKRLACPLSAGQVALVPPLAELECFTAHCSAVATALNGKLSPSTPDDRILLTAYKMHALSKQLHRAQPSAATPAIVQLLTEDAELSMRAGALGLSSSQPPQLL
eukprot:TRINITY_DN6912_c0_g1_i2.p1 TRINITY_DN6912_c0_g1~~TRINITY_DN6912_c0_g1_i2.p1  ORF type:complete len:846 (+),score=203.82 TRINITY_DN6912_c0_g1_i2:81-2618(+)